MKLTDRLRYAFNWTPVCDRLLDIGGDTGAVSNEYLKKATSVSMIDCNRNHLAIGRKKFPNVKFYYGAAERLPFKDAFFDVVTMTDTFEHVHDERKTMDEVHRVLKPGGKLILSVPHRGLLGWIDPFNFKFICPWAYRWLKGRAFAERQLATERWHRHYSLRRLRPFLAGRFVLEKVHRGGMLFPFLWVFQDLVVVHVLKNRQPRWLQNLISWLYDQDYSVNWGLLGYHIIIRARKV
jgi:SAM-dependent methyltransferase